MLSRYPDLSRPVIRARHWAVFVALIHFFLIAVVMLS
jgi:hypothetical protein